MAITKDSGRQYVLSASIDITGGTNVTATGAYEAIDIPAGATVVGGGINVTSAFDATVDLDIGDGVDPDRYTSTIINADATGFTALTLDGYTYTANDTIDVTVAVAAATQGAATLIVNYVMDGRSNENFG